jgi:predicted  nucleic acid-binding Zn-ribbon protein
VDAQAEDWGRSLAVLESVRCLDCGVIYSKPADGGTARQNPGCPKCGYVGWLALDEAAPDSPHAVPVETSQHRFA